MWNIELLCNIPSWVHHASLMPFYIWFDLDLCAHMPYLKL